MIKLKPLKPCPFCGGKAGMDWCSIGLDREEKNFMPYCRKKNCILGVGVVQPYKTKAEAINAWNQRISEE